MYSLAALLAGVLIAVMVAFNGELSMLYGVYAATALTHLVGLAVVLPLCIAGREKLFAKNVPWYLYLGGVMGVLITVCNNISFGRISVSSMLALGLFAQSILGFAVDHYGLMGMPRHPFGSKKLFGLALTFAGIAVMTDTFDALAVSASLLAGAVLLVSRTISARLAERTSLRVSTFYNYLIGFFVALPVVALLGRAEPVFSAPAFSPRIWVYLGGAVGVCVVILLNLTVTRVSAFGLSLLLFIGQVFAGLVIDILFLDAFSPRLLAGGLLVAAGLAANAFVDKRETA